MAEQSSTSLREHAGVPRARDDQQRQPAAHPNVVPVVGRPRSDRARGGLCRSDPPVTPTVDTRATGRRSSRQRRQTLPDANANERRRPPRRRPGWQPGRSDAARANRVRRVLLYWATARSSWSATTIRPTTGPRPGSELADVYDASTDTVAPSREPQQASHERGHGGTAGWVGARDRGNEQRWATVLQHEDADVDRRDSWQAGPLHQGRQDDHPSAGRSRQWSRKDSSSDETDRRPMTDDERASRAPTARPGPPAWSPARSVWSPSTPLCELATTVRWPSAGSVIAMRSRLDAADDAATTTRCSTPGRPCAHPKLQVASQRLSRSLTARVLAILGGNGGGELAGPLGEHRRHGAQAVRPSPAAKWTDLAPMAEAARRRQVALLADGRVLGRGWMQRTTDEGRTAAAPRLRPRSTIHATDTVVNLALSLLEPRASGAAITLRDATVLVLGGQGSTGTLVTVERLWLDASTSAPGLVSSILNARCTGIAIGQLALGR